MTRTTAFRIDSYPIVITLALVLSTFGCSKSHTGDEVKYLQWLNDPRHGLMQVRTANGLRVSVKYLPPDYRAFRELRGNDAHEDPETVKKRCGNSLAFLLSISRDTTMPAQEPVDPHSVIDQGMRLNEDIKERLSLRAEGTLYQPVVSALDNDAGMSGEIRITAVFADSAAGGKLLRANQYDVTLDDEMFGTGISHFLFNRDAIESRIRFDY